MTLLKKIKINIIEYLILILCIFISFNLIIDKSYSSVIIDGIKLFIACIMPTLIPYAFISELLSHLKIMDKLCKLFDKLFRKVFRLNGCVFFALLMSLISGYPMGATIVSSLKEKEIINDEEAIRASCLCSTSSLSFTILVVGGIMLNNYAFGIILFISHLLSSLLVGFVFSFYKPKVLPSKLQKLSSPFENDFLYSTMTKTMMSVFVVGGIITLFYLLTEMMFTCGLFSPFISALSHLTGDQNLAKSLVFGFFETTKGLKILCSNLTAFSLPLSALMIGFGGLSVQAQSIALLKRAKIKIAPFFLSKIINAILSFFISFIFSLIFF